MLSQSILNTFQAFNLNNNDQQLPVQEVSKCKQLNARFVPSVGQLLRIDSRMLIVV